MSPAGRTVTPSLSALTGLPCNFVVDKEGILKAKYLGYAEDVKRHFEGKLNGLLLNP